MELKQLEYFLKIAELQNITKAAEKLHITQPALSKALSGLEKELGVLLFDRKGRYIILNQNGGIFQNYVKEIFILLKQSQRELNDLNHTSQCTIHVSLYAASRHFPMLVNSFKKKHPQISFVVNQHSHEEADIRIFSTLKPDLIPGTMILLEEEIGIALPMGHPMSEVKQLKLTDLKREDFISLRKGKELRDITDTYCKSMDFHPKISLESDDPSTIRSLIHAGFGIAFMPTVTWREPGDDTVMKLLHPKCMRYLCLYAPNERYRSVGIREFITHTAEYFKAL